MKSLFQKIGAFVLATLILVATSSFSVRMHYCGQNLVSVSVNKLPKSCCKLKLKKSTEAFKIPKKSCCHDTEFTKLAEDNISKAEGVNFETQKKEISFTQTFSDFKTFTEYSVVFHYYSDYSPPLVSPNRQVLFQTFLI